MLEKVVTSFFTSLKIESMKFMNGKLNLYKVGSNWLKKLIHKITVFIKQLLDLLFPTIIAWQLL